MMNRYRNWFLALLLSSPIIIFNLAYLFNHDPKLIPTGFIQYDNVTYAGNAIQYNWPEHHGISYSNRLNDSHVYEQIYFNPQLLLLAFLNRIGLAPGYALMLFNLLSSVLFFRMAIGIYDDVKQTNQFKILNTILFSWGGGLLCLSGFFLFSMGVISNDFWSALFVLDPAHGWWGLNAGRSLFFSLEAWYHLLFFAAILSVLKKRWVIAAFVLLLLSLSHPFTGIELLLILFTWVIIEFSIRRSSIPLYFSLTVIGILGLHIWYYLVFLNKFPEHHSVFQQYSLNWKYRFYHFIPAYILTALLTILAVKIEGLKNYFSRSGNRLFICWAIVAFTLANHELFIKPMQPLHFTRGYIWAALFFACLPGLHYLWKTLSIRKNGLILVMLISLVFLSDNLLWIVKNSRRVNEPTSVTLITPEQKQILEFLSMNAKFNDVIVGSDEIIPYLASIYTKSNIWFSHPYNTPNYETKKKAYDAFIQSGQTAESTPWYTSKCFFIVEKSNQQQVDRFAGDKSSRLVFETSNYSVYLRLPISFIVESSQLDSDL